MRRLTPVPASQSREVLVLESPEAFADALLARPPRADENHLIARERNESLRHFALRTLHRLERSLSDPRQVSRISYLFRGERSEDGVRGRFLKALAVLAGAPLEAETSPSGWTILSARNP